MELLLISQAGLDVLTTIRYIFLCIIFLGAISIIFAVLCQNQSTNAGSITGGYTQDSYYSKHKGSTIEEKLSKFTRISAIVIGIFIVLYYITFLIMNAAVVE